MYIITSKDVTNSPLAKLLDNDSDLVRSLFTDFNKFLNETVKKIHADIAKETLNNLKSLKLIS